MGSSSSAPSAPPAVIENPADVETSSGFHILEVHAPTAGLGFVTLFVALTCFCCGFGAFSWYKKHHGRRAVLRQAAARRRRDDWLELGLYPGLTRTYSNHGAPAANCAAVMPPLYAADRRFRYQAMPPRHQYDQEGHGRFQEVYDEANEEGYSDRPAPRSAVLDNI